MKGRSTLRRAMRCAQTCARRLPACRKARRLSRPIPKASDRQRTLARIGTTGRAACVIDGGGASAPLLLPLLAPEGIVLDVVAPRGSANRLLLLLRRRQIGNAFAGGRTGDSFLRRGGRDIVGGGHGVGGLPRQGRVCRRRRDRCGGSLRPNGSRAIGGLSTAFRTRTTRALGAMAGAGATAGADVSLDLWTGASEDP